MKIRIYSPFFPFPVTEGSFQVIGDQIQTLAEMGHDVEVILIRETSDSFKKKFEQANLDLRVQWRPVGNSLTESRALRVFRSFFSDLASPELYYYPLLQLPEADFGPVDLAIYHYGFAYSWLRNRKLNGESKRVVYFHNLESELSLLRAKETQNPLVAWVHQLNFRKLSSHERRLKDLCNEIWFIGPSDQENYFKNHSIKNRSVFRLIPPTYSQSLHTLRKENFKKHLAQFENLTRFGIIGDLGFRPNHDSAKWILEKLAPLLLERKFDGKILIGGKNAHPALIKMAKPYPFIEFLGFVQDIEDFWNQISFMLVPHVSGSGVRIKLLEAIASSVPVVANPEAVQRTHPDLQNSPFLKHCQTPEEWSDVILQEKPFQTRKKLMSQSLSNSLRGSEIYSFLNPHRRSSCG